MSFGVSFTGVTFFQAPTVVGADNGTSLSGTDVVLGNDVGGNLATLLSNREIPLDTFFIQFLDNVITNYLRVHPTAAGLPIGIRFGDTVIPVEVLLALNAAGQLTLRETTANLEQFIYDPLSSTFMFSDSGIPVAFSGVVNITGATKIPLNTDIPEAFGISAQMTNNGAVPVGSVIQHVVNGLGAVYIGTFGPAWGEVALQNGCGIDTDVQPANFWMNFSNRSLNSAGFRWFHQIGVGPATQTMEFLNPGRLGIRVTGPTAAIHLPAGTAAASGAPFKYTAGTNLAVVENGAKEFDGTNEFLSSAGVRYTMAKTLTATGVLDFPNTGAQLSADLTIAVTGAADGDVVALGVPVAALNADSCYTAFVSAANTVTVRFNNYSAGAIDPASGTFRVSVIKY